MKKTTAKRLGVFLSISYLIIITGIFYIWWTNKDGVSEVFSTNSETVEDTKGMDTIESASQETNDDNATTFVQEKNEDTTNEPSNNEGESILKKTEEIDDVSHMVFAGDVYLGNYVSNTYEDFGITGILSEYLLDEFQTADLAMVNEEFPFSERGEPMEDKQYTFRIQPKKVQVFTDMGLDIVSLANNHTLDYGKNALMDTFDTLDNAEIAYVGAGRNLEEAKITRYFEMNGKKVAILSASRVLPVYEWYATANNMGIFSTYDPTELLTEIELAKQSADVVIVYVHWGIEKVDRPKDYQRTMGKAYIDAGADLVIGSHPHVLQGVEYYKGKLIVYSLGNFIFSQNIEQTALLKVDVEQEDKISVQFVPCKAINGKTSEITNEDEKSKFYDYITSISYHAFVNELGIICEN